MGGTDKTPRPQLVVGISLKVPPLVTHFCQTGPIKGPTTFRTHPKLGTTENLRHGRDISDSNETMCAEGSWSLDSSVSWAASSKLRHKRGQQR